MKHTIPGLFLALLWLIVSCDDKKEPKPLTAFSEIANYFESEINALKQSNLILTKIVVHGDMTEKIILENPDWAKELMPFSETVSNHPAQIQSYNRDSIIAGNTKILKLTAKDNSAVVKSLTVYSTGVKTDSVVIVKQVKNSYYFSSDSLSYYGNGNFLLKAENIPGIGKQIAFVLEGRTSQK